VRFTHFEEFAPPKGDCTGQARPTSQAPRGSGGGEHTNDERESRGELKLVAVVGSLKNFGAYIM
jgi:hypothetical protein